MAIIGSDLITVFLTCICALAVGFYVYVTRNFKYWKNLGVKHLEPSFPFGNFGKCTFLRQSIHEFLDQIYYEGKEEKMVGFYVLDRPYIMLRDPELLRSVFIKDFNLFTNKLMSNNKSDPFGTHALFLMESPPWKKIRQNMSPMFTSGKLKKNFDLMLSICKDLDTYLNSVGVNDQIAKPIEIQEVLLKLMTDIIGITAYNIKFNSLTNSESPFQKFGKLQFESRPFRYIQLLSIFFVPAWRIFTKAQFFYVGTKFFEDTFLHIVDERIQSGDKKNDFVDWVIDMLKNEEVDDKSDIKVKRRSWMVQLSQVFTGGFETSSTTTSFALYLVAMHSEVQQRLRDELTHAVEKNGKLTYDVVTNAPYLNMVVREVLRMYPLITWVDRLPDVDYTFPGTNVTIKKGTPVIYPIRSMHMDPKYFPEPEKFDPERFSDENKGQIVPFSYAPFSEGPRNCIGGRLGLLQVKLAVAYFVVNYQLSPCGKTPIPLKNSSVNAFMHPHGDVYLDLLKIA
ncbi:cytochrome P450 6k1-like [Copidosoma floridanum]|uniref:cytochrome P450 6k1-like n=1 Tax=Copidosoma floridanum TaxID=29053 RepID=UPI0006C98999|nr:cytochrome P450 6k1-like [Copidosoma floridanum]